MKQRNSVSLTKAVSIGAVWFGAHVGGGFATGNQGFQYFAKYGTVGILMPILIMALIGWNNREIIRSARLNGTSNYRSWALAVFSPIEKPMAVVIEIETLILYLLASSGAIAGCASLFVNFGLPYLAGVIITGGILMIFSIFGSEIFRKASSVMSVVLICSIFIVLVAGISQGASNLSANAAVVGIAASPLEIIWSGLKYGGFQAFSGITMIAIATGITSEKEVNAGIGIGFVMNASMTALVSVFLLAWYPAVSGQTLPILTVLNKIGNGLLIALYSVSLALAFITTALGAVFGTVARFEPVLKKWSVVQIVKRISISVSFMVIAMGISLVGLDKIVRIGYGYVGVAAIFTIILPAITVIFIRNNRDAKGQKAAVAERKT